MSVRLLLANVLGQVSVILPFGDHTGVGEVDGIEVESTKGDDIGVLELRPDDQLLK